MKYPVYTALVTPLLPNGDLDQLSLKNLLQIQQAAGNGIVILGSTGEALNLSLKEKIKICEITKAEKLTVPVLVGIGGQQLDETLHWVKTAEEFGFDGHLMVTPIYSKPGVLGQTLWFESLMNQATKPCMLYNVPGRAAVALHPETTKNLREHPRFWALKEASGSIEKFAQYSELLPKQELYAGDDGMLPFFTPLGAQGVVSVASNVWPQETKKYAELCLALKYHDLLPLWMKATNALFLASNPVPVKALMHLKGMITTPYLKSPLHHEDFHHLEKLSQIDFNIQQWFKEQK